MSAAVCPTCKRFLRTIKPSEEMEGQIGDRLPFHRTRPAGPICPGAGRHLPLAARKPEEAS